VAASRYHRSVGEQVRLQAGTDDNALKNVLAAAAAGTRPWDLAKAGDRAELAAERPAARRGIQVN
jgi:methionyl-tRNA synthetase